MATINTLANISVPTGDNNNQPLLMPKLQYRFRVFLDGFGNGGGADGERELTRQVVDVTRPNLTFEQITIDAYNSRTYLAGKHTWEPITLTLREDANINIQKIVGQQLQRQFDFYEQASARSGGTYKFSTRIEILDGGNGEKEIETLETFELVGCYIESANYNQLAYSSNDPVTITLTIRYDNAIQYGSESTDNPEGIGTETTRSITNELTTGGNGSIL